MKKETTRFQTCDGEEKIISVIAVRFGGDRIPVDASNNLFLGDVGGQHLPTGGVRDGLGQLGETAAVEARHAAAQVNVAADRHQSRVDAEAGDDVLPHAAALLSSILISIALTCTGVTSRQWCVDERKVQSYRTCSPTATTVTQQPQQPCDRDGFRNRLNLTFDFLTSGLMHAERLS